MVTKISAAQFANEHGIPDDHRQWDGSRPFCMISFGMNIAVPCLIQRRKFR
ncbi:MAG: hypothetical protein ACLRS2_11260 [[Clostridium] innocuum]